MSSKPDIQTSSNVFKEFYHHFFEDLYLVGRGEISVLDFYPKLNDAEKQMALTLLREAVQNAVHPHQFAIESLGLLKDGSSVPLLKEKLSKEKQYYFRLIIAKAIYRINKDAIYFKILERLPYTKEAYIKIAFAHWLLDFGDERTLMALYRILKDGDVEVKNIALRLLNFLDNGFDYRFPLKLPKKDASYFLNNEKEMMKKLLFNKHIIKK